MMMIQASVEAQISRAERSSRTYQHEQIARIFGLLHVMSVVLVKLWFSSFLTAEQAAALTNESAVS